MATEQIYLGIGDINNSPELRHILGQKGVAQLIRPGF